MWRVASDSRSDMTHNITVTPNAPDTAVDTRITGSSGCAARYKT
jgi:hypothetical protein